MIEPKKEASLVVVTGNDVDQESEVENLTDKEGCSRGVYQNLEADAQSGMQAVDDQSKDVVLETVAVNGSVDLDQTAVAQDNSSESVESLTSDLLVETACENGAADVAVEIPVSDPVGELVAEKKQNLETASCPVAAAQLDSQVAIGSATEESEQVLATGNREDGDLSAQVVSVSVTDESSNSLDGDSGTVVNDLVDPSLETTELNKCSEVAESLPSPAESLPSPADSENVPVESVQVDASQPTRELNKSLKIAESLPSVDSENVPIEVVQIDPFVPSGINYITTKKDAGFAAFTVSENSPSCYLNGKLGMQNSKISDSHPVENTNITEVENGLIGDDSVSPWPNNDARSEIETVDDSSSSCEVDGVKRETENGRLKLQTSERPDSRSAENPNVTEVENGPIGNYSLSGCPNNVVRSVVETVTEHSLSCEVDDVKRATENGKLNVQSSESSDSHPVDNTKVLEVENGHIGDDSVSGCPNNDPRSEIENAHESTELQEKVGDDSYTKSEVSEVVTDSTEEQAIVDNAVVESSVSASVENEIGANVKSESEIENESGVSCRDVVVSETGAPSGSVTSVKNGGIQSAGGENDDQRCKEVEENELIRFTEGDSDDIICQEVKESGVSQTTGEQNGDKTYQEVEDIDVIHKDETATTTPEGSAADASETQNVGPEVVKRPFYYLVKVPRNDDENIREQIKSAQSQVDEKTRSRDTIRDEIQTIRATYKKYSESLEAILSEERAARELLKSKRQEIDSLQSAINKVKTAISVEDIDSRIRNMERMIAHETLPLKEEKQFIRDIKQLKQLREQLSSSMGKQDEIQQAFDQKDQIEGQMKLLRKEADSLRDNVLKAEAATHAAKRKQRDESEKLKKLLGQFKAADDIRQEAYKQLQSLKKQAYDKNKYFWKYKDDAKQANDLAFKGDKEALQQLCLNHVERALEIWNSNDEFRKEYVNSNIRSTLRRLKTLDGRSLGPDEEPPIIRAFVNDRAAKDNSEILTVKIKKTEQAAPVKPEKQDTKPMPELAEQKNQTTKSKRPAKSSHSVNGSATVTGRNEIVEVTEEEPKRTKEEEELARKAEELRKEEEAAKLKEQRRLEEKAKAKEALERKKRNAEKAQARAVLRAQKEAELKEQERVKKAKKKEKKKATATKDTNLTDKEESAPSSQTPLETPRSSSEVREKSTTLTKRPQKPSQFSKQTTKAKSIPLPLRNRGKRRIQSWTWVLIAALVVFALLLLGNSSLSSKFGLEGFGF